MTQKTNFINIYPATLPNSDGKDKALKFINQGDHHQILRKEIVFGLRPLTGLSLIFCVKNFGNIFSS